MDRSRNTLAIPAAAVAALVVAPCFDLPAWVGRVSFAATGHPLASEHALLLGLALLIAARGLLLGRLAAGYGLLAVLVLGILAVVTGEDPAWRLPLLLTATFLLWRMLDLLPVRPHPARVRAAVRTALTVFVVAVVGCVVFGGVGVRSAGSDAVSGLGGGLDVEGAVWLPRALSLLGWIGLIVVVRTLLAPAPPPPPGDPAEREHVTQLVADPGSGTLAPFAMRQDKSYVFSPGSRAAIGYRVLFGVAVAGGDPVGDPRSYDSAVNAFRAMCDQMGWRPAVLASEHTWPGMRAIGIGDEVVLHPGSFTLEGRAMRNVRQAVKRSHNAGVTTQIIAERSLTPARRAELLEIASKSLGGAAERGFSMILDELLTGWHPGCMVAIASVGDTPVAFQRYASCGAGLSLDSMRRLPDSPNGVHERLIVDLMAAVDVKEVSLNFAAFRELLDATDRTAVEQAGYRALHLLDPLISVESLYLFNRKFRPEYRPRAVQFRSWKEIGWVGAALLTLEFGRVRPSAPVPEVLPEGSLERP
jgi:lysyl-tRNA synthetase class 2